MFKDIQGYEGIYQISDSNEGILSLGNSKDRKEKILSKNIDSSGYEHNRLWKNGKSKIVKISRLVAEAFIPNPDNLLCVLHLDNNPLNNHKDNLKWGTYSDNNIQAYRDGSKKSHWKGKLGNNHNRSKGVIQYSKDGSIQKVFGSISEAYRETGIKIQSISQCCIGKQKVAGGFVWKYNF